MTETYRVIQWAMGSIGQIAIQSFARNPQFELVGCYVTSAEKVGRDAGEIAGIDASGVTPTRPVRTRVRSSSRWTRSSASRR